MTTIYKDAGRPVHERVADLLARMTPEEKFAQMHAYWLILDENGNHRERSDLSDEFAGVSEQAALSERLKLGVGQITRPLGTHIVDAKTGVRAANRLQRMMMEETRLGIPALFHEECLVGLLCKDATLFPSSLNYGSTWDPELVQRAAEQIGKEARSVGCQQGLAPVLDVSRDVRWGRTEETFGEDPWLVGVMATAYVKGLQGDKRDLLATLKHYVGHSFSEGARNHAPVHLGFSELNDTFLLPFEMAVKLANAGSVMPAYHDIDNQPGHSDSFLLTTVLREQWGFDGIIVADYGGVSLLHQHHGISHDAAESAALAFNAGLDVELPKDDCARHLAEAVERGLISMAKVDEIVARTLTEKFRLGLFEKPYADENGIDLQNDMTRQAAREVAGKQRHFTARGQTPRGGSGADGRRSAGVTQRLQLPGAFDHQRYGGRDLAGHDPARGAGAVSRCIERPLCQRVPHHRKTDGGRAGLPWRQRRQTDAAVARIAKYRPDPRGRERRAGE